MLLIRFIVISAAKIQSYFDITKQKQSFFCFYIKIFCFTYYIYVCRLQGSHIDQHAPEPFFYSFSSLFFSSFLSFHCSSFALDPCRPPRQHIMNRAAPPPPPTTSPPFRHPQQPPTREPTATRSTDEQQHTTATPSTASGRAMGAPSPRLVCLTP